MNNTDWQENDEEMLSLQEKLFFAQVLIEIKRMMVVESKTNATLSHSIESKDSLGVYAWVSASILKASRNVLMNQAALIERLLEDESGLSVISGQIWNDLNVEEQ